MSDQGPPPSPWPSDHLTDAERRLARLWHTMRTEDGAEWVELTAERDAIVFAVEDALTRASAAARALNPPPGAAVNDGLARFVTSIRYLRADLVQGVHVDDMTGQPSSSDAYLENAAEELAVLLEDAERRAGRPPLTHAEAVADITERLQWDRP